MIYKITKYMNNDWSDYDKTVAATQMDNYNMIFLDEYDCPIDDENELEYLYTNYNTDFCHNI